MLKMRGCKWIPVDARWVRTEPPSRGSRRTKGLHGIGRSRWEKAPGVGLKGDGPEPPGPQREETTNQKAGPPASGKAVWLRDGEIDGDGAQLDGAPSWGG